VLDGPLELDEPPVELEFRPVVWPPTGDVPLADWLPPFDVAVLPVPLAPPIETFPPVAFVVRVEADAPPKPVEAVLEWPPCAALPPEPVRPPKAAEPPNSAVDGPVSVPLHPAMHKVPVRALRSQPRVNPQ
jgi:hypothetical protein